MKRLTIIMILTAVLCPYHGWAQKENTTGIKDKLENYFKNYKPEGVTSWRVS